MWQRGDVFELAASLNTATDEQLQITTQSVIERAHIIDKTGSGNVQGTSDRKWATGL